MRPEELLVASFFRTHPDDGARILETTSPQEAAALLESIEPEAAAIVARRISATAGSSCLAAMSPEAAGAILAEFPVETAVQFLRRMEGQLQEALLGLLPNEMARPARLLLQYPENTAGALMDPLAYTVPDDVTAEQIHLMLRRKPEGIYYYVYVVDRDQRLRGVLDLRQLMRADAAVPVSSIMIVDVTTLPAEMDLATLLRHPGWHELDALPVVDEKGIFLGMIRQRLIRQISESAEEDNPSLASWEVLLALGELYWIGLGKFLDVLMEPLRPGQPENVTGNVPAKGESA